MQLEKIITLANAASRLRFLAMERSLRATGCNLPLWVIPYNKDVFTLPKNAIWWDIPEITNWTEKNKLWPAFRKIQCLLTSNYQFVDSDVIFLINPSKKLCSLQGFITSCGHWHNPGETITSETLEFFKHKTTTWPRLVFNSGQWACDRQLFQLEELISFCENNFTDTLFKKNYLYKDQAGVNLLVNYKDVPITNLTLPPVAMESTWAGDYMTNDYKRYWTNENKTPYIIHWAGCSMAEKRPIDELFFKYLTDEEKKLWDIQAEISSKRQTLYKKMRKKISLMKLAINALASNKIN